MIFTTVLAACLEGAMSCDMAESHAIEAPDYFLWSFYFYISLSVMKFYVQFILCTFLQLIIRLEFKFYNRHRFAAMSVEAPFNCFSLTVSVLEGNEDLFF